LRKRVPSRIAASILDRAGRALTRIDDDFDNAGNSAIDIVGRAVELISAPRQSV
jgi:hypothetical protein